MAGKNRANKYSGQKVNLGALYGGGGDTESIFEELTTTAEALPIDPNDDSGAGQMADPVTTTKQGKLIGFQDKRSFLDKIAGKTNTASALNSQLALEQERSKMTEAGLTSRQGKELESRERLSTAEQLGLTARGKADNTSKETIAAAHNVNAIAVENLRIEAQLKDLKDRRADTKQAVLDGRISAEKAAEQKAKIDKNADKLKSRLKINEDAASTDYKTLAANGYLTTQKVEAAKPLLTKALAGVDAATSASKLASGISDNQIAVLGQIPVDTYVKSVTGPLEKTTAENVKSTTFVLPENSSVIGAMPGEQFGGTAGSPAKVGISGTTTAATPPVVQGMSSAAKQSIAEFLRLKAAGGTTPTPTKPPLVTPPVDEEDAQERAITKRLIDAMRNKKTTATPAPTPSYTPTRQLTD